MNKSVTGSCEVCGGEIVWMAGGLMWMHRKDADHEPPNPAPDGQLLAADYIAEHGKWWQE